MIERCLILSRGEEIGVADLPPMVRGSGEPRPAEAPAGGYAADLPLAEVERQHILQALDLHEGNKVRTAKSLGINVKTLYNKLKTYAQQEG